MSEPRWEETFGELWAGIVEGRLRNPSNVHRGLRAVLNRVDGYDWVTSHMLRKTVATPLDDAGLSARAIVNHGR